MTPEDLVLMERLCTQIKEEKNPVIFDKVLKDLLKLLEAKHLRTHPEHKKELEGSEATGFEKPSPTSD